MEERLRVGLLAEQAGGTGRPPQSRKANKKKGQLKPEESFTKLAIVAKAWGRTTRVYTPSCPKHRDLRGPHERRKETARRSVSALPLGGLLLGGGWKEGRDTFPGSQAHQQTQIHSQTCAPRKSRSQSVLPARRRQGTGSGDTCGRRLRHSTRHPPMCGEGGGGEGCREATRCFQSPLRASPHPGQTG